MNIAYFQRHYSKLLKNALFFDWLKKKPLETAWAELLSKQHGNLLFRISCAWISCLLTHMEAIDRIKACNSC